MKKVHWINTSGEVETVETDESPDRRRMQEYVGGSIELVWVLFGGKKTQMYVNDTGLIDGLPLNEIATSIYHEATRQKHSLQNGRKNPAFIDDFKEKPYLSLVEHSPIAGNAIVLEGFGSA